MFNDRKLRRFKIFSASVKNDLTYRYIFHEDNDIIIDIHMKAYETENISNITGQLVKICGGMTYPNIIILGLLRQFRRFKPHSMPKINDFYKTYSGDCDIAVWPVTRTNQIMSLLPTIKYYDQIWINDLKMKASATYFVELFDVNLWIAFLVSFLCIGLVSALGICLLKKFTKNEIDQMNWFSTAVNQGVCENSEFVSRRVVLVVVSLIAVMFHGGFGAFMSSSLAVRHPDIPFADISSLLALPSYTVCTIEYTSAHIQITHEASKLQKSASVNSATCPDIFANYSTLYKSSNDFGKLCPLTNMVYIVTEKFILPKISADCRLVSLKGKYFSMFISMIIYPGFKYREPFNQGLIRLRTAGVLDHLVYRNKQMLAFHVHERKFTKTEFDISVPFAQIILVLGVWVIGMGCALGILLLEIIFNNFY